MELTNVNRDEPAWQFTQQQAIAMIQNSERLWFARPGDQSIIVLIEIAPKLAPPNDRAGTSP